MARRDKKSPSGWANFIPETDGVLLTAAFESFKTAHGRKAVGEEEFKVIKETMDAHYGKAHNSRAFHDTTIPVKPQYGLSADQIADQLRSQGGAAHCQCAICNRETRCYLDHHKTDYRVRGYICQTCRDIIYALENDLLIKQVAAYLANPPGYKLYAVKPPIPA